jgi:hypothetical protein
MKAEENRTYWKKMEEAIFPIAAAVIGIGYSIAIFANNPLDTVIRSPHAIIILIILISIAFFPLRAAYKQLKLYKQDRLNED